MYDYDKNAMYDHNRAVMQHIRGLCEKYNLMISREFLPEEYNIMCAEIKAACNMAKTCGQEIRLFALDSFDITPIVIIWVHDTTTGEIVKAAIRYVSEYGEIVSSNFYKSAAFHPYYLKREFNIPRKFRKAVRG